MGITCEKVEDILEKDGDICAVLVTSPTYEGIVSDIRAIAEVVHRHHAVLIVDEAHGAHLPFSGTTGLPQSAISQGADLVIQSLHKTLPALTMSAAIHVCGDRVDYAKVEEGLRIFETSSPSYVMMAGMDACMRFMKREGEERLGRLCSLLDDFYSHAQRWSELYVLTKDDVHRLGYEWDQSRIVFGARYVARSGMQIHRWLTDVHHLQPEMATPEHVVLISTIADTEQGFERLIAALDDINDRLRAEKTKRQMKAEIAGNAGPENAGNLKTDGKWAGKAERKMAPYLAMEGKKTRSLTAQAAGKISAEMAYIYPPGIPFLMPGEVITEEQIRQMQYYRECGHAIHGLEDESGQWIRTVVSAGKETT
jgi:arginine/lysine/ornithine decarboxylase